MVRSLGIGVVMIGVMAATAPSAHAQPPASRERHPFRWLFGPTESEEKLNERLFLSLSTYGAVDDSSRFGSGADIRDLSLQSGRLYQGAEAQLSYLRRRPRAILGVTAASGLRYYASLRDVTTSKHTGSLSAELIASPRVRVKLTGDGGYAPNFQLQLGSASSADPGSRTGGADSSVYRQKVVTYGGTGSVIYTPNRASELVVSGGAGYSQFLDAADYHSQSAGVKYTRILSRDLSLRLGYGQSVAGRSDTSAFRTQNIDAGLNYSRGLVLSPRTSIEFSSGSAIVSATGARQFVLLGSGTVNHQLARRWTVHTGLERTLQTVSTAARPFVAQVVSSGVTGYPTRRTAVRLSSGYARGADVTKASARYSSLSNQVRTEFALNRFWALYIEHFYYRYAFTAAADLSTGPPQLTRQGARGGLTLWAPVKR